MSARMWRELAPEVGGLDVGVAAQAALPVAQLAGLDRRQPGALAGVVIGIHEGHVEVKS